MRYSTMLAFAALACLSAASAAHAQQSMDWARLLPGPPPPIGSNGMAQPQSAYAPPQYTPPQPYPSWTGERIGNFDYWHGSNGQTITCQTIGQFRYCN